MKGLVFVFVSATLLTGCMSSYVVSPLGGADSLSYQQFNDEVKANKVRIELTNGREMEGINLDIGNDSAHWVDPSSASTRGAVAGEIKTVVSKNHWLGGLNGFKYGFISGAVAVGALGGISGSSETFGHDLKVVGAAIIGGTVTGLIGGIVGLLVGQKNEYDFVSPKDSTKK